MTGDEFRTRVRAALDEPVTDAEIDEWNCQCAADLAQPLLARVEAIVKDDIVQRPIGWQWIAPEWVPRPWWKFW
jgi:hypothetical protein